MDSVTQGPAPPESRSRAIKLRLFVGALIFLSGICLLDIFLDQRRDEIYPDKLYLPEYDIVINRPDVRRRVTTKRLNPSRESFHYSIFTDSDGCRTERNPQPYSHEIPAVAVLGDSFSFGHHAEYEETFAGRLQLAFPQCKVYNFAVAGTCSRDYPKTLEYFLKRKAPVPLKAVVVSLFVDPKFGDWARSLARRRYGSYKEISGYYVGPTNYRLFSQSTWARTRFEAEMFFRRHSSICNSLLPRPQLEEFFVNIPEPLPEAKAQELLELELSNLDLVRQVSGLPASSVLVQLMPSSTDTYAMAMERNAGTPYPTPSARALWDRIAEEAARRGYVVVDNRTLFAEKLMALRSVDDLGRPLPFAVDGHMTATGFDWLSETLTERLRPLLSP